MFRSALESAYVTSVAVMSLCLGGVAIVVMAWQIDPGLLLDRDTWKCIVFLAPIATLPLLAMLLVTGFFTAAIWRVMVVPSIKLAPSVAVGFTAGFFMLDVVSLKPLELLAIGCAICLAAWLVRTNQLVLVGSGICLISIIVAFSMGVLS